MNTTTRPAPEVPVFNPAHDDEPDSVITIEIYARTRNGKLIAAERSVNELGSPVVWVRSAMAGAGDDLMLTLRVRGLV